MLCPNCGAQLHSDVLFCPYCGIRLQESREQDSPNTPPQDTPNNDPRQAEHYGSWHFYSPQREPADGLATASLVCGILSAVLFCCGFFPLPVSAIVLGIVAKVQGNRSKKSTLGIVFGAVGLVLAVIYFVFVMVVYSQNILDSGFYYYW